MHAPYSSIAQVRQDLVGGQIAAAIGALSDLSELHRSGRIRVIATSGATRSTLLPAVATFREQGLTAIEATGWTAIYAPAGTPRATVDRLSQAIVRALRVPAVRERLTDLGMEPTGTTADDLQRIIAIDRARWASLLEAVGWTDARPR